MQSRITQISGAEEQEINHGILRDPDNPEWGEADFARARPARPLNEVSQSSGTVEVTLKLDTEVVTYFQRQGTDWRARINEALRRTIER